MCLCHILKLPDANAVFQSFPLFVFGKILSSSKTTPFNGTEIIGIEYFWQGNTKPNRLF